MIWPQGHIVEYRVIRGGKRRDFAQQHGLLMDPLDPR